MISIASPQKAVAGGPYDWQTQDVLGAQALTRLKQRLRGDFGKDYGTISTQLGSMFQQYNINSTTGRMERGTGGGLDIVNGRLKQSAGYLDTKGYDAVNSFLSGLRWTSQDFGTKQKEFRYGAEVIEDRIAELDKRMTGLQEGYSKNDPNYEVYTRNPDRYEAAMKELSSQKDMLTKQREASMGFSGLMDLAGQVYEGKQGAFTNLLGGLQKATALMQSVGGTYQSAAAGSQAAAGEAGLVAAIKGDLVPLLGESGAAASEKGYSFNLAGLGKESSESWQKYFDARIAADEKGVKFDENKWATENASDALRTIIQSPAALQQDVTLVNKWTGAANNRTNMLKSTTASVMGQADDPGTMAAGKDPMSTETLRIQGTMVDRVDPNTGKPILKGTYAQMNKGKVLQANSVALEQQRFLNRADVTFAWEGSANDRTLVAKRTFQNNSMPEGSPFNVKDPNLRNDPRFQQGLVQMAIAARDNQVQLPGWGQFVGSQFGYVGSSLTNMMKAQEFARGAPERHKYDEMNAAQAQARGDLAKAQKMGYSPTTKLGLGGDKNPESVDQFLARKDMEANTVVRR